MYLDSGEPSEIRMIHSLVRITCVVALFDYLGVSKAHRLMLSLQSPPPDLHSPSIPDFDLV